MSTSTRPVFEAARAEGRAALVGYLPAGFPDVEGSIDAMRTMVENGCDLIEVGLPYSDPVMDGPTIQAAAQQALEAGTRTRDVHIDRVEGSCTITLRLDHLALSEGTYEMTAAVRDAFGQHEYDVRNRFVRFDVLRGAVTDGGLLTLGGTWTVAQPHR